MKRTFKTFDILSLSEQKSFDLPPVLNDNEQEVCFKLSHPLKRISKSLETLTYQVGFTLLCGYYQISGRFFPPSVFREQDISYVCYTLGISLKRVKLTTYNRKTLHRHKNLIRDYWQIKPWDEVHDLLHRSILDRVARHQSPYQILKETIEFLKMKRIEVPTYNQLATVITQTIAHFEQELTKILTIRLSNEQRRHLDQLLEIDQTGTAFITRLKTMSHSRRPREIRQSVQDFQHVKKLYQLLLPVIQTLNLHDNTLKHYATWIRKASLYQIKQRSVRVSK